MNAAVEPQIVPQTQSWRRYIPVVVSAAVFLAIVVGAVLLVKSMLSGGKPVQKKMVQQITLIAPPPPPPVERPPEPEIKDDVKLPEPVPEMANEPPAGSNLGVDAEGGSGDNFGLIGKKGGRDLLSGGPFASYLSLAQQEIVQRLNDDKRIRRVRYKVAFDIWIAPDGGIQRFELRTSTGDQALDELLKRGMAKIERLSDMPPPQMSQPLNMVLRSSI